MAAQTQDASDYYVWQTPGKTDSIQLHLDVLDRLGGEVMRGFGAVPKRGAEVGGVLIGTVEHARDGEPAVVRIEDFEPVECEYRRGPSYLFTEDEKGVFEEAVQRWQPDESRTAYAVGFYRSQTRDGLSLAPEDVELLDEFFPGDDGVALLIKPYGTKVSEAGFFVREDGKFPDTSPLEFPFRRYELTGEAPPPRRSLMEPRQRGGTDPRQSAGTEPRQSAGTEPRQRGRPLRAITRTDADSLTESGGDDAETANYGDDADGAYEPPSDDAPRMRALRGPAAGSAYAVTLPSRSRFSSSVWLPLSFVFLLFGVALGMMISLARAPKTAGGDAQGFSLGLAISKSGQNLSVKWDSQSPAVRAAQQGFIEIQDGNNAPISKELDPAQLQNGGMIYTSSSNAVKFRLTVNPRAQLRIEETVEWRP